MVLKLLFAPDSRKCGASRRPFPRSVESTVPVWTLAFEQPVLFFPQFSLEFRIKRFELHTEFGSNCFVYFIHALLCRLFTQGWTANLAKALFQLLPARGFSSLGIIQLLFDLYP